MDRHAFIALTLLVGQQEGHPACKNWVVGCWHGYLSGVRCRHACGPADATATHLTVSCFCKIQIGFTFLVLAHLGSPGQRAVKHVCVWIDSCLESSFKHTPPKGRCTGVCVCVLSYPLRVFFLGQVCSSFLHWLFLCSPFICPSVTIFGYSSYSNVVCVVSPDIITFGYSWDVCICLVCFFVSVTLCNIFSSS